MAKPGDIIAYAHQQKQSTGQVGIFEGFYQITDITDYGFGNDGKEMRRLMSCNGKPMNRTLAFAVIALGAALPLPPSRAASPSALPPSVRGHVALLDFWATTCGPCRPALTRLQSLHVRCPRLAVLGIAMDEADTQAEVKPLLREQGVTYPVRIASAANLRLARALGVQTYPALFLLDARGKVVWSHSGPLDAHAAQALTRQVARLLTSRASGCAACTPATPPRAF